MTSSLRPAATTSVCGHAATRSRTGPLLVRLLRRALSRNAGDARSSDRRRASGRTRVLGAVVIASTVRFLMSRRRSRPSDCRPVAVLLRSPTSRSRRWSDGPSRPDRRPVPRRHRLRRRRALSRGSSTAAVPRASRRVRPGSPTGEMYARCVFRRSASPDGSPELLSPHRRHLEPTAADLRPASALPPALNLATDPAFTGRSVPRRRSPRSGGIAHAAGRASARTGVRDGRSRTSVSGSRRSGRGRRAAEPLWGADTAATATLLRRSTRRAELPRVPHAERHPRTSARDAASRSSSPQTRSRA